MVGISKSGKAALAVAAMATALAGCSTKPRNFAASVSTPVPDRVAFEQDYRTCAALVKSGHSSGFKTAATSTAIGAGAVGAGASVAALGAGGTYSSFGAAGAAAGTVLAAATVVTGLAGFGITRAIRGGKERKFKRNMSACLSEYGYEVADWEKLKKRDDAAAFASRQVAVAEPRRDEPVMIDAVVMTEEPQPAEVPAQPLALVTHEG
ncbi:hypothetical protein [Altererythrobacter litoralis]|uniref:Glycine zipper family protein n=1 Tax=Altererythrobacter litoralis TaxID=3113904 RepID=A0ABU7GGT4_9SPHN|nr:hypothetical protein [Erythrobacteraceae bacterium 1XM1-14]